MKKIAEHIWISEKDFSLMGADLGNRMTVIELNDNKLVLHSPHAYDQKTQELLDKIGTVQYIITPNRFHGLFANDWMTQYPSAEHYAVSEVRETFNEQPTILNDLDFSPWAPQLLMQPMVGMDKLNEYVFFHPLSQTLILTDLCFNIQKPGSLWSKVFFRMNDSYKKFGPSRIMKSMISNGEQLGNTLRDILDWDFDRIILSHGDIVEIGGKEMLTKAFKTHLNLHTEMES